MIKWLGNRLVDGAACLLLLTIIFEGPTVTAVIRDKLGRRK